ncbi:SDR family oxidoreductase [Aureibacter tunicatorum]|uniref:Uncharacterized protein YbjT (DUF2867 family) n=1 Tax=Aureibacter tunicatorum TaxID=866807 RepID=A0AAE4BQW2_9BACT|nr:SDR family oxidoreductase [Aureibacter tunicatorum]MDR6237328.1 uncharacterized protein YbjT (DUF2867 family) [Aureibacter tunicatorum]BDD06319.1 epimerase [Aureibacter tunicatorum]
MKILLTGATGYIGRRMIPFLVNDGHYVVCLVRDKSRLELESSLQDKVEVVVGDLNDPQSLECIPKDIEVAYFLVHSMSASKVHFLQMEHSVVLNFINAMEKTSVKQIIYLSGIVNDKNLSRHLFSRMHVEDILRVSPIPTTTLRAAIIIGSGSASFEIIRDLVEKLPVMIAPRWLNTKCQPIAIRNVLYYLSKCPGDERLYDRSFDIGGPDVLSYKQMLLQFAQVRKLKRYILTLPVLSPNLSAQWLRFVTSTSMSLAESLVDSMKNEVIVKHGGLEKLYPQELLSYKESVSKALRRVEDNEVISSWKDAYISGEANPNLQEFLQVPKYGCFIDDKKRVFTRNADDVFENIWTIGGRRGWYAMDPLWKLRGLMDKMVGGVGLRRGRRSQYDLKAGDALDFWRVLVADKPGRRLLLFAEMKVPGEAWLEFEVKENSDGTSEVRQTATFRPKGLLGRLYWYAMVPFHHFIFNGMIDCIVKV